MSGKPKPHLVAFVKNKAVCYYKDGSQEIFMDGSPEYQKLRISASRSLAKLHYIANYPNTWLISTYSF